MADGRQVEERLSAYLDGELSPEEQREIEAFLRDDPAAEAELSGLREVGVVLRGAADQWEQRVSFDDFYDKVAARVPAPAAAPAPRAPVSLWGRVRDAFATGSRAAWVAAAAVAVIAVGLGSVALLEGPPAEGPGLPAGAVAVRGGPTEIEDLHFENASAVVYKTPGDVTVIWLSEEEGT